LAGRSTLLLPLPRLRHIFNAQFAFVAYERELQAVLVGSAKLVNPRSFATLRIYPAGTLECNRVARDGVGSPRVALALMLKVDVERAIRLDHPNGAERVRPVSNKRSLSRLRIRGAGIQQHEPEADENNSTKRELYFHAAILSAGFSLSKHLLQQVADYIRQPLLASPRQ
jgi:hypothetical protein